MGHLLQRIAGFDGEIDRAHIRESGGDLPGGKAQTLSAGRVIALRPAMTDAEIACYTGYLARAHDVVEYGCGGSTFLAVTESAASIFSVESDPAWIEKIRAEPQIRAAEECGRLTVHHADIGPISNHGYPADLATRPSWPGYSLAPWKAGRDADLVLVDGRFRTACTLVTLLHARETTLIALHDFWNRPFAHPVLPFLEWVESADSLGLFRPRKDIDHPRIGQMLATARYSPG